MSIKLAWYPFDIQTCSIQMVFDGVLDNYADILAGSLVFSGEKELTQYFVKKYDWIKNPISII